ncbi:MAG: thioredoxin domain-containing protein [Bacteroidetes bacterium]|nr:thioredoxin domain-containing protein [Bacteroidota bacterium]
MRHFLIVFIALAFCESCQPSPAPAEQQEPETEKLVWNHFSAALFDNAGTSGKLILLHVGAQWCHWCHVMEDSTYSDPQVQRYLNDHFILAKEDQDSRPDLFTRYRSYGWPAIILFDADANEILKLRGYQEKNSFLTSLETAVKNPTALNKTAPAIATQTMLNGDSLNNGQLLDLFESKIDFEKGSLNTFKKSLFAPSIEMALSFSNQSDSLRQWLQTSIENSFQLIDPEWGGVFQYSTHYNWQNAHYERLLRVQAEHIVHYTRYGCIFNDATAIEKAEFVYDYCNRFLSERPPLFNNSQDADYKKGVESTAYYKLPDSERRKLGVPLTHPVWFLKENALMAKALVYLWAATGNTKYLVRAEKILALLRADFKNETKLYQRSTSDSVIFSLDDNVAMLDALILANKVSGDPVFLTDANELAVTILASFTNKQGTLNAVTGDLTLESAVLESSGMAAVFSIFHLACITRDNELQKKARLISTAYLAYSADYSEYFIPFRLLKNKYLDQEPMHAVLILNEPGSEIEQKMIQQLIALGEPNLIIERINLNRMTEEQTVLYGSAGAGTLFLCNSTYCSSPVTDPAELKKMLRPENKKTIPQQQYGFSISEN